MIENHMVHVNVWRDFATLHDITAEEKYLYLYLLTNDQVNSIGIYTLSKKMIECETGYSVEHITLLMERLMNHHKLIRYNVETYELAIKNWAKHTKLRGGKQRMISELTKVEDPSLISFVSESIRNGEIRRLYGSFCH
ncbi:hypothetical protein ACNRWW_19340 [Metabacillus sp. HB246100]